VAIIGAGPIGLSAAIAATNKKLDYLVLEKGVLVNSIFHFPRNMTFFSTAAEIEIGGLPFICQGQKPTRVEALQYYRRVAQYFRLNIKYGVKIESITNKESNFIAESTNGDSIMAKNIILAIGYYDNPNFLGVPGEKLPKVSHYYSESHFYFGKKVVVVGGRNSAAEAALEIFRAGAEVTLVHRGEGFDDKVKYWVRPDIENRIKNGEIKACFNSTVRRIDQRAVTIQTKDGLAELENDYVLALTGYHPDVSLMQKAGVVVDADTLIPQHDPDTYETNVKGLYIAGALTVGREANKVFIENGRLHGEKIIEAMM
jgi:thioredoxin reductase (NADPH)